MHKGVILIGIEYEEPLVEQHIGRMPPGALDHELRARLAEDSCGLVDELAGIGLYAKIDAALRIARGNPLRDSLDPTSFR
jgi:hypothetical protein